MAEMLNLLYNSIFVNLKIASLEPGDKGVVSIYNRCAEQNHVRIQLQGIAAAALRGLRRLCGSKNGKRDYAGECKKTPKNGSICLHGARPSVETDNGGDASAPPPFVLLTKLA